MTEKTLPKLSVVTIVLNNERTIEHCIQSVLNQTYSNIEYIVLDGGSTDNTVSIIEKHKDQISYFKSEKDAGPCYAQDKGSQLATGDLIAILNSDDYYSSNTILESVADAYMNNDVEVVYGDAKFVAQHDITQVKRYWNPGLFHKSKLKLGWEVAHPSFFVTRRAYQEYGYLKTTYRFSQDYELVLRMMGKHALKSVYIPDCLVTMRLGGDSNQSLMHRIKGNLECWRAWRENGLSVSILFLIWRACRKILSIPLQKKQISP